MEKVILDCDPGHDDAIAIMLAAGNPAIDLLGITTVAGNQTLEKVTRNALSVCTVSGIRVPVARGSAGPLVGTQVIAEDIHGDTGLDGPVLPEPAFHLDPRHAVEFIIDTVMAHEPGTVNLVPVGPLTNIALALRTEPRIADRVKSVVLMGGAHTRGNVTPHAEFNVYADPEAAEAVFRADWEVTMVGLDTTHQALATAELQERVRAIGGPVAGFALDIWGFVGDAYRRQYEFDFPPVHDACCIAALIDPAVLTTAAADVRVELRGEWTRGTTVVNFADVPGMHHSDGSAQRQTDFRTRVALGIDQDRFADLVVDAIGRLTAEL
ncbi:MULTISPECIES: nucleoside hydrolase [Microbacterium]|uniref:nucleoside hydrolase n=1 Tax=Microbacterium TaxID=33882 RepID=UPI00217DC215|nr:MULTISPECIES: nucleoside hydrolase [Microbacterium]UWF77617.1 nucleoside hydrolase [Microbacterium neungamense]WCM55788.1 nucleoside hydrolase [Microbacterium sp. EF45047]